MKRSKTEIVLRALQAKIPITIGGLRYLLDDEGELCQQMDTFHLDGSGDWKRTGEVLVRLPHTIGAFHRMCEKATEEEIFTIAASHVLTEINREGGPSRPRPTVRTGP